MILDSYRYATGGGGGSSYLDELATQPRAVLSLAKLISTATTAIRVRRSSDSAEMDVGFSGDALDSASMLAWSGSDSVYVTTVYDQTGNAEHLVQATAANQPRIVNAGTYDGQIVFNGSNSIMQITSLTAGTPTVGLYTKMRTPTTGAKILIESSANYNTNPQSFVCYYDTGEGGFNAGMNGSGTNTWKRSSFPLTAGSLVQATVLMNRASTGTINAWQAGTALTPTVRHSQSQSGNFTTYDLYVGARSGLAAPADMGLFTLVFYNADSSGIRTSIEGIVA